MFLQGMKWIARLSCISQSLVYGTINDINNKLNDSFKRQIPKGFNDKIVILSGSANRKLSEEVASYLNTELGEVHTGKFNDGECNIQIKSNVRGRDVYVIQSTCVPVNDNLVELLLMVSALRRSSAKTINVVVPYFAYSRQDHKDARCSAISCADVAKLLETCGIDRLISVDLHRGQIQGFFPPQIPVDHIEPYPALLNFLKSKQINLNDLTIVSPDFNGVSRAKRFQDLLKISQPKVQTKLAMIYKQKQSSGEPPVMSLVGDVTNRNCLIIDDIIDSGITLQKATQLLIQEGAHSVNAYATHAILSQQINIPMINHIIVTDTIPSNTHLNYKFVRLSCAPLIAEAIYRIQTRQSLDQLKQF